MHAEREGPDDRRRSEAGDLRLPRRRRRDVRRRARRAAARRRDAVHARRQPALDGAARRRGQRDPRSARRSAPLLDKSITYDDPVTASRRRHVRRRAPADHRVRSCTARQAAIANRDALARAIGAEIERLRDAPPVVAEPRQVASRSRSATCMVLTRTNKESVADRERRCARAACRARSSRRDKLFETREAAELAAVLDAIAAPRDRSARMRALRTRFFDVPWAELMRVVDAPDHHPLIARLFDWAALAARREYETLFRRLVEDSRFAERALVLGGGERALVNTWHLIELLLEEVARSRCDLHELVARLRRWIDEHEELADDRDVQRAETDADAIRILTIHKAKGLEAPYVFLFGGATRRRRSSKVARRCAMARAARCIVAHDRRAIKRSSTSETDGREPAARVRRADARAGPAVPAALRRQGPSTTRATYQPIQRCVAPLVDARASRVVEIDVPSRSAARPKPPAPADALADVRRAGAAGRRRRSRRSRRARRPRDAVVHAPRARSRSAATRAAASCPLAIDPRRVRHRRRATPKRRAALGSRRSAARRRLGPPPPRRVRARRPRGRARGAPTADDVARRSRRRASCSPTRARERGIAEHVPAARRARSSTTTLTQPLALTDGSELPPLVDATALAREVEFTYPIPPGAARRRAASCKGFIDALVAWTTTSCGSSTTRATCSAATTSRRPRRDRVREHYSVQARLYAIAADRLRGGRRLAGLLFAFVRHDIVVPLRDRRRRRSRRGRRLARERCARRSPR